MMSIKRAFSILASFTLLVGCGTTKYVPVIEHKTDTVLVNRTAHDSIYRRDSIHVWERGDTVLIERWHTQLVKKEVRDTTYISKTDSVPVPYPVTEYVEKPLTKAQTGLMWVGGLAILWMILFAVNKLKRLLPGM